MAREYFRVLKMFQILLISLLLFAPVQSQRRRHSPLVIEDDGARRGNRPSASECQFGKTVRELGSTWFPDLGEPYGVMYCIKCECVAVHKKRRIVGHVQCRNLKDECKPANCDDPILLPGKCCKTCPGENFDKDVAQDVPAPVNIEEEERNMKHFAALLTGRTSYFLKREDMKSMYPTFNPLNAVATGRFLFHKKSLYYSFYVSSKIGRPRAIQFVDDAGAILEERNLMSQSDGPMSAYQNNTGKVCGVWRRVPRDYKRLLRDERLHVVLLWGSKHNAELALAGKIGKYTALQTETFSSLLEPAPGTKAEQMAGSGGTAIVSTSSGAASSIHLTLVFNGVFNAEDFIDAPVNIRIELPERKDIILEEVQKIRKPSPEVNVLEISSPISIQSLRLLGRGKLLLTVESKKNPNLKIQGHIVTRTTCEMFQTLLSAHTFESKTRTSGLAWVYLNTDGSLAYNIQTDSLDLATHPEISLIEDIGKRKTLLEDLTKSLNFNQAIGTIDKLGPRVLESLYTGDLAVNIAVKNETSLVKGKLISRPVADARDSAEPILLRRQDTSLPAHSMGMAWIAIDNDCNLHYEVTVHGLFSNQQTLQIVLEEKPIEAIGAPVTRKVLEEFTGSFVEGYVLEMPSTELIKLETSVCYLKIFSKERDEILLRGKLKSTKVPSHCFPLYTDNNVPSVVVPGDHNDNIIVTPDTKCFHAGRFYDEADTWQESCTMCSCQHGRVTCDPMKCPNVTCRTGEELTMRQGECCPTCVSPKAMIQMSNSSVDRGCRLGDQFHQAGASWHPYLPPNGFDTCTTCRCDPLSLQISCPRMTCPPLTCSEKLAYRPDKKACCKVCPENKGNPNADKANPNELQDQAAPSRAIKSAEEILSHGGCKVVNTLYENGQEWHPIIASHGEQKCVNCRCKDSRVSCERKRCTRSSCNNRLTSSKRKLTNLQQQDNDECCASKCRRVSRHHRRAHPRERDDKPATTTNSNRS